MPHAGQRMEGGEWYGTPFAHEREEVACARILLAKKQPTAALQRLEPVLVRASTGQRWGHVIEMRLLQALAYQMRQQETQALDALSQAVRLTEPEGYIRSFVDEGPEMAALLSRLRMRQNKYGPTPYMDTVLAAFPQESAEHEPRHVDTVLPPFPRRVLSMNLGLHYRTKSKSPTAIRSFD